MKFLRKHWYDLGGVFSIFIIVYVLMRHKNLTNYQILIWLNLVTLFFHQLEEYRIAGTFPGMLNTVVFKSEIPDRYPLNTRTALYINVDIGWLFYFLAAVFAEKAMWLGVAVLLVSAGNVIAHTFLFNIKGKTIYNAGLVTCWLLFVPSIGLFLSIIHTDHLVKNIDFFIGIPLGIILNVFGILKPIAWLADKETPYVFEQRNLLLLNRQSAL